ncbi:hypothetical protein H0H81_011156 [Sphagnurus paluster]|uniref:Uncharacterized protein n=1 Tax=Sphagnurus paluster TaxID=117069 RepID=A0A9P7K539_9AGAR|nr:hypothetical protein H0H81_011156 [Sphagnurus paluster]
MSTPHSRRSLFTRHILAMGTTNIFAPNLSTRLVPSSEHVTQPSGQGESMTAHLDAPGSITEHIMTMGTTSVFVPSLTTHLVQSIVHAAQGSEEPDSTTAHLDVRDSMMARLHLAAALKRVGEQFRDLVRALSTDSSLHAVQLQDEVQSIQTALTQYVHLLGP